MKRAALLVALALTLPLLAPDAASAQQAQGPAPTAGGESDVPFVVVTQADEDNPYAQLDFETSGDPLPGLLPGVEAASALDEQQLLVTSSDVDGFRATSDNGVVDEAAEIVGVPLVGEDAPAVESGGVIDTTSTTNDTTSTSLGSSAIPALPSDDRGAGRQSFAFTDENGNPIAPPDDAAPVTNPPSPPTEGVDATPPSTTTTTTPAPDPGTTASSTTTTTAAPTTTTEPTTSTTGSTTTTSTSTTTTTQPPTTTTTTQPSTTTTTRATTTTTSTSTTSTSTSTTTTQAPTTTTTQAPPTTTTTTPPQQDSFSFTQERPSATACVATNETTQDCDAIWEIHVGATNQTLTFDLALRNSGNVDASAIQMWAASACTNASTATPAGTGDLCGAIQLSIQRYSDSGRTVPVECVYGGGTAQACSMSSARTLSHFASTYPSSSDFRAIGTGLNEGSTFYLRVSLKLPDLDNRFQNRSATINLTWRQVQ